MKTVLDVGNCNPDHASLCALLNRYFKINILRAHASQDALGVLQSKKVDLVIVNRKMDLDYSDGLEIVKQIKEDAKLSAIPVMLLTNSAEFQDSAVAAGAEPGFGKTQYNEPDTFKKLAKFLS